MRKQRAQSREQGADELTDAQCAALLGLTKARRVRVQWRDGRAVCTAEVRANSVDEAIVRLRRMEGLNLNCVMRAWEVTV